MAQVYVTVYVVAYVCYSAGRTGGGCGRMAAYRWLEGVHVSYMCWSDTRFMAVSYIFCIYAALLREPSKAPFGAPSERKTLSNFQTTING